MGCGASKNKIHVAATEKTIDNTNHKESHTSSPASRPNSKPSTKSRNQSAVSKRSKNSAWGSTDSLGERGSVDTRGGSAVSKASKHSMDSGFDDKDYANVITESSNPNAIKQVEEDFETPRDLDLGLVGQQCPQRLSAKDKDRLDEQRVMASLQQEGLIARPMSRAGHGVRFDIVAADMDAMFGVEKRPPARLAKLEKKRKKKKLTEADIEAKLARAEERRKEQEQQRLAKIQAVTMKSDVQNALDAFAARQKDIDHTVKSKEELVLENRMKKLQEKKDRLRAKQEHAEAVRRRKMLAPIRTEEDDEEEENIRTHKKITEDTPIGVNVH